MADVTAKLAEALRLVRHTLKRENEREGGPITDTIWFGAGETLLDFLDNTLAAYEQAQAATPAPALAGWKLAPDYRGYALLGTGRYLIDSTDAPADPELGAELIISIASEADREGREIGERRDMPARTIQPESMAVRIGFANERGLFALEGQLWTLRQEHWPGTQSAATPAPAPAQAQQAERPTGPIDVSFADSWTDAEKIGFIEHCLRWPACGYVNSTERVEAIRIAWKIASDLAATPAPAEPVAWTLRETLDKHETTCSARLWFTNPVNSAWAPLYAAPQAATPAPAPQPLTDEQIEEILYSGTGANRLSQLEFARAIERAHGIGQGKEAK